MAKLLPIHLVIRDASAANDNVLDNFDHIIALFYGWGIVLAMSKTAFTLRPMPIADMSFIGQQ